MKNTIIIINHIRKNLFPFFVVALIMLFSGFLLVSTIGEYNYITAAKSITSKSDLDNALFFSLTMDEETGMPSVPQAVYDINGVDSIIYTTFGGGAQIGNERLNVTCINSAKIEIPIAEGRFIDEKSKSPECVLPKKYSNIVSLGDSVELGGGRTVTVVGFTVNGYPYPDFSKWGTNAGCDYLFENSDNKILMFDPEGQGMNTSLMAVALLSDDIYESDIKAVKATVSSYGPMLTYDSIMKVTNIKIQQLLKENLPLPVFLLVISFITMICVVALSINRSMNEHSKYYLIGCSKKQSVSIIVSSLVLFFSIPTLINILLVLLAPGTFALDPHRNYIVNMVCVAPLIVYLLVVVLISSIIPVILYSTFSPLDFYRRNL